VLSAVGNLSAAYNFTIISLVLKILESVYPEDDHSSSRTSSLLNTSALIGAIIGQLTMGYAGDYMGRGKALSLTMSFTILGALLSSMNTPYGHPSKPYAWITLCRILLGIGVGGVYPLAATISAESSASTKRGRQVSLVFSTQGFGLLLCPLLTMLVIAVNPSRNGCSKHYVDDKYPAGCNDVNWRILLGLGALPGILMLPFKVKESPGRPLDTSFTARALPIPPQSRTTSSFWKDLAQPKYWPKLVGTAGGWFLFDVVFYGNTLFAPTVLKEVFHSSHPTILESAQQSALVFLMSLPGYFVATFYMDKWGRKNLQLYGFILMGILYGAMAGSLGLCNGTDSHTSDCAKKIGPAVLLIMYGLTFFFSNCGPNATTFILPAETFPREVRSTMNGFSAAMGKVGACLGTAGFGPLANRLGVPWVLAICGIISIAAAGITGVFVEDRRGKAMAEESQVAEIDNEPLIPDQG